MMKEPSWLFKAPLAHAISTGEKTETRRVLTPLNTWMDGRPWSLDLLDLDWEMALVDHGPSPAGNLGPYLRVPHRHLRTWHRVYPRISVGDLIWVREKHFLLAEDPDPGDELRYCWVMFPGGLSQLRDMRTGRLCEWDVYELDDDQRPRWRPSIYMPRYASRLTCEVLEVSLQRIQDITTESIRAEAVHALPQGDRAVLDEYRREYGDGLRAMWAAGWDSINAPRGYGWRKNPWVIAYRFRGYRENIDALLDLRASGGQDVGKPTEEESNGNHQ